MKNSGCYEGTARWLGNLLLLNYGFKSNQLL